VACLALAPARDRAYRDPPREQALLGGLAWRYYAEARKRLRPLREKQSTGGSEPALRSSDRHAHPIDGARANSASAPGPASTGDGPPGSEPWLLPILVDYFTRDGSTLMMRLLCTSPHVVVDDQYPYERKYFNYLWRWSRLLDRGESPSESWGSSSLAAISQEWHVPLLGPPPWHPRPLFEPAPGDEFMSRRCFQLAWAEFSRRAARATAGDPEAAGRVAYYAEKHLDTWMLDRDALPSIEVVVLLRDPRDTYCSIRAFNGFRGIEGFGRHRAVSDREHLDQLIARQRERLRWIAELPKGERGQVVRYEDLVLDTDAVARQLERRFGIELDAAAARGDTELRRTHVSASSPEASIGRWKDELDAEAVSVFRRELGLELEALGFEA
jgi:hypothetical protein